MCPQGARLGLGQGFRNAPLEIRVKARAGLEECFSWELEVEAGWGRATGMFPQSTPLTLEQKYRGLHRGRALPHPPSGSRMAVDQVSVWGSASCRQGFGLPWGGDGRLKALLFLSKNTLQMLCLTSLSVWRCIITHPEGRKRNGICSLTFVLSWRGARSDARYEIAIAGKKTCLQTYSPKKYLVP